MHILGVFSDHSTVFRYPSLFLTFSALFGHTFSFFFFRTRNEKNSVALRYIAGSLGYISKLSILVPSAQFPRVPKRIGSRDLATRDVPKNARAQEGGREGMEEYQRSNSAHHPRGYSGFKAWGGANMGT